MRFAVVLSIALALLPARSAVAGAEDEMAAEMAGAELTAYVDSVVKAYGGAKKVAKLARHRFEGEVVAHIRGGTATFRRDFVAPSSLRVDLSYPDRSEVRILAGKEGWRGNAKSQAEVKGMPHTAMTYQMLRASAPWFVIEHQGQLKHVANESKDGAPHRVLRLTWSKALALDFWVDEGSRRITKVEGTLAAGHMTMSFATHYSDFKKVRGVLVPHTEKSYVNGRHTGTATLTKLKFGVRKLGPFSQTPPHRP